MPLIVLALLIGVPILEIALFIEVGDAIGLWPTIGIVIVTAIVGTTVMRQQGMAVLASAQRELAEDRLPVRELFDGACLLVGGALLLTPGFFTDALGLALLIPPARAVLGRAVMALLRRSRNVSFTVYGAGRGPAGPAGPRGPGGGPVIDGDEFGVRRDDDDDPRDGTLPPHDDRRRSR